MKKNKKGGYIGLLVLLIGVSIIVFLIIRADLFTGQKEGKNMIEQELDTINKAKEAKNLIEYNSQKSLKE